MTSAAKKRIQALSEQLANPPRSQGEFEGIPKIPMIAGDSRGP